MSVSIQTADFDLSAHMCQLLGAGAFTAAVPVGPTQPIGACL